MEGGVWEEEGQEGMETRGRLDWLEFPYVTTNNGLIVQQQR